MIYQINCGQNKLKSKSIVCVSVLVAFNYEDDQNGSLEEKIAVGPTSSSQYTLNNFLLVDYATFQEKFGTHWHK